MKKVQIDYLCQHLSCKMPCREGTIIISEKDFVNLRHGSAEAGCMRSPSKACKIGFTQDFKILSKKEVESDQEKEVESAQEKEVESNQKKDKPKEQYGLIERFEKLEEEKGLLEKRILGLEQSVNELLKKKEKEKKKPIRRSDK